MRILTCSSLVLLLAMHAMADEPVTSGLAATNAPALTATNMTEEAEATVEVLRDPFWPVGYVPPPPEAEQSEEEVQKIEKEVELKAKARWPALNLKGVTRAGKDRYLAIVEDIGLVEKGETISLRHADMLYSWKIDDVSAKGVSFTRLEARPYQPPAIGVRTQ